MEEDHQHQHHHHHHRLPLKKKNTSTTTMNWKHKLRDNCFNRIQADRNRLIWKLRTSSSSSSPPHDKDLMDVTFRDIVSDELNKLKNSDADVDIWEYHTFQTHSDTECQDILIEMQTIFYEDLRASQHTTTEQDDYEGTWEEEDDYLAKLVLEQLQLKTDQICNKEVWCPICKQGELKEDHRIIYCTRCKLQLSRGDEVNVEILRARLAEAHSDHLEGGCMLAPKFCMETRFNLTALYIQCEACSIFEIVL